MAYSALDHNSEPEPKQSEAAASHQAVSFFDALAGLLRSPQRLLFLWNWKNAVLSLVLRGPIFLVATIHRGWQSALAALFTESVFCVLTAGFYGAIVQILRSAEPEWLTVVFLTLVMPGLFQVLEYWLHWLRGTPHLRPAEFTSIVASAISALFNWYAMRRGALLVGAEGRRFGADLRRLPRLAIGFLTALPRKSIRRFRAGSSDLFRSAGNGECL
jgi:hypothetical protein